MLIDANIFVELFLDQKQAISCQTILNNIASGESKAIVSTFTIDSIIITLESKNVIQKIPILLQKIITSQGLTIYKPTLTDRVKSLKLMKKYNLSYEDSLTLQCALANNCKEILSFDHHFDKIKEVQRIEP